MFEFLKNLLKRVNFKTDNEEMNKYNKIIYCLIIFCAVCFIGIIIYFIWKYWPEFIEKVKDNWENSKWILKQR